MVCGYISRKAGIIDAVSSKNLSRLILMIGQPMMIIAALANANSAAKTSPLHGRSR